jgi:predicted RNA-binding Zn ribbon-like protein
MGLNNDPVKAIMLSAFGLMTDVELATLKICPTTSTDTKFGDLTNAMERKIYLDSDREDMKKYLNE